MFLGKLTQIARRCHTKVNFQENIRDEWKSVIGLEIHAQLSTQSKLFSSAPAVYGASTNAAVTLFDGAVPGTLPSLNKKAVELAVTTALALRCKVNAISFFDRKHYFYSDLPAGYQITQQRLPIAENGKVEYAVFQPGVHKKPYYKTSHIKQIQLEQDSGKTLYESTEKRCYIDLNRAGIAVVEIVFQPDVENEEEACAVVKEIVKVFERIQACSCKMEEGALRVDVNVSVHKDGSDLGVRTEIKNLGSISSIKSAIKYEIQRQIEILNSGGSVKNETLAWDQKQGRAKVMRQKESKQDYRFMPEPNLPPLRLLTDDYSEHFHKNTKCKNLIFNLRHLSKQIPSLPQEDRKLLIQKYGLSDIHAFNLVGQDKLLNYFKEIMEEKPSRDSKLVHSLLMYHLLKNLNLHKLELSSCSIPGSHLGEIVDLTQNKRISSPTTDYLLTQLLDDENSLSPNELVEKHSLFLISNPKELRKICLKVLEKEPEIVASYKKKKRNSVFNSLRLKVVEESNFRADSQVLGKLLMDILDETDSDQ